MTNNAKTTTQIHFWVELRGLLITILVESPWCSTLTNLLQCLRNTLLTEVSALLEDTVEFITPDFTDVRQRQCSAGPRPTKAILIRWRQDS